MTLKMPRTFALLLRGTGVGDDPAPGVGLPALALATPIAGGGTASCRSRERSDPAAGVQGAGGSEVVSFTEVAGAVVEASASKSLAADDGSRSPLMPTRHSSA